MTNKKRKKSVLMLALIREKNKVECLVKAVGKDGEKLYVPMRISKENNIGEII